MFTVENWINRISKLHTFASISINIQNIENLNYPVHGAHITKHGSTCLPHLYVIHTHTLYVSKQGWKLNLKPNSGHNNSKSSNPPTNI